MWIFIYIAYLSLCPYVSSVSNSILITGAGGFIGSQLQKHLLDLQFGNITGLDNFDVYYSVPLKLSRVEEGNNMFGAEVIEGDVCDAQLLHALLRKRRFTHIVHLAAQAGVRYSINHPLKYIRDNIECFTVLLEQIRLYGEDYGKESMPKLVYASSSSVYGANKKIPFSEIDTVEKPSNIYGATKRMDELLAFTYFNLYGIKSIGMRFFTVYGPWGRPDMAAWKFTEQILRNETITIFNEGKMKRDFTFVNDTVRGIAACLSYEHDAPEVFNLGYSKPVETMHFLRIIEKSLGKKAKLRFEESKAEIAVTFANTTLAEERLGFKAVVSLEDGMHQFTEWFRDRQKKTIQCESGCSLDRVFLAAGRQESSMCSTSAWATAATISRALTEGCEIVLYKFLTPSSQLVTANDISNANATGPANCNIQFISHAKGEKVDATNVDNGWTTVLVEIPGHHELQRTYGYGHIPRIAPWMLFASSVRYAVGIHSRVKLATPLAEVVHLMRRPYNEAPASVMLIRNSRVSSLYEEARLAVNGKLPTHQVSAYAEYEKRENVNYDNVFDPSLVVFDLQDAAARDFSCEWYREAQEWFPWNGSSQLAGAYVIAKRAAEATAASGSEGLPHGQQEWIPISYNKQSLQKMSYVRILSVEQHAHLLEHRI